MKRSLIAGLVVALLAGSAYVLGYSTFFTVSSVEVIGSSRPLNTGITKGQKLARVEPRALATKLEKLDWVRSAKISRNWINGKVVVQLTSRTPIAIFENKVIVVVDDVLNTGRTFSYSLAPFLSIPVKKIQVAVLVDRNYRKFPISADYKGYELSTTLSEHVEVIISDAKKRGVYLH